MNRRRALLAYLFVAVLMVGVLVTWSPSVWPVSVLQLGIFGIALASAVMALLRPEEWAAIMPRTTLYIPMALIALWGPLQIAFGSTVYRFDTWYAGLYWFTSAAAFCLGGMLLGEARARDRFLTAFLYFGCTVVIFAILQSYTSPYKVFWIFESTYRVIGPFVYKNQFAAFVELLMPIALYRMLTDRDNSWLFAFLSATMFAAVVASASRAGAILLAVEILAVLAMGWRKGLISKRIAALLFLQMAILIGICCAIVGWEELGEHFQDQTTANGRLKLAVSTLHMIRDYPAAGVGLGNWKAVYPRYALFDNGLYANAAHNDWAQWAAEGGVVFAGLLLWILIAGAGLALRNPWGAGVVFVLLHSFVDYPTREPIIGVLLFTFLGAMTAASRDQSWRVVARREAARRRNAGNV